ncbi:hypothetical protein FHS07_002409 [Microbacterium proteolyticum]|uniref:Uncharacterized protein n=1 Tax=Microbacterium proteolyticum TaxID=1572644 RepID=A0A7W5CJ94_9MICO|nr:hypothetical protein [Microbacterium proteolyticum]MBB3158713.1 hypothetical protein [Microbacterium proteolyticum]
MPSQSKVRARLIRGVGEQHIVRVERRPTFADRLDGFVIAVGDEWALMAQTSDGGFFNGYVAFRLSDVKRISFDESFETAFARTQPEWPPVVPFEVDLGSTSGVLRGMGRDGALVGIQKDHERSAIWIGQLDQLRKRKVYLLEVNPDASWDSAALGYTLKAITTVETGTKYLTGLAAIAGTGPGA